jgi:hypothetical protein
MSPGAINLMGPPFPHDGDLLSRFAIIVALFAVVIIVIPVLLFGVELLIFAVVASATLIGSLLAAPRWQVRATDPRTGRTYAREVAGRRESASTLQDPAELIRTAIDPLPSQVVADRRESVPPPG